MPQGWSDLPASDVYPHKATNLGRFAALTPYLWPCEEKRDPVTPPRDSCRRIR
jgi:hypothetical protein